MLATEVGISVDENSETEKICKFGRGTQIDEWRTAYQKWGFCT